MRSCYYSECILQMLYCGLFCIICGPYMCTVIIETFTSLPFTTFYCLQSREVWSGPCDCVKVVLAEVCIESVFTKSCESDQRRSPVRRTPPVMELQPDDKFWINRRKGLPLPEGLPLLDSRPHNCRWDSVSKLDEENVSQNQADRQRISNLTSICLEASNLAKTKTSHLKVQEDFVLRPLHLHSRETHLLVLITFPDSSQIFQILLGSPLVSTHYRMSFQNAKQKKLLECESYGRAWKRATTVWLSDQKGFALTKLTSTGKPETEGPRGIQPSRWTSKHKVTGKGVTDTENIQWA